MPRPGLPRGHAPAPACALILALASGAPAARAQSTPVDDPRTASEFFEGLRDRGYFDLAADYLEAARKSPEAPAGLVATADFEMGRLLLEEASKTGDIVRRRDLLEQARNRLDAWSKANPDHPKAPEALVSLARLLGERGHLAMLQADESDDKAEKDAKVAESRASLDQARAAYEAADKRLQAAFAKFPSYLADGDPRKAEKEQTQTSLMNAQLQRAVIDFEQGETYPPKSPERTDLMKKALAQFEDLYKKYRQQLAGLSAQMWEGKCFEEQGEYGKAMGIYNALMEHADPRLRPLQRTVGRFRIVVLGKRKEYALAADEAVRWLQENRGTEAQRSPDALGVQLELAKDVLAQLPGIQGEGDRNAAVKKAVDTLANVVRYSSPFKAEAVELLKKYKPSAALNATDVAKMGYEEAMSQGESAIASREWDRAAALLRQAVRKAETARDADKLNLARHSLAFCFYMNKKYYEAFVLGDQIARRYPKAGVAPKSAEIGMAALEGAYNAYTQVDRAADLNNMADLASYTAEAFAESEPGDSARLTLGLIRAGTGRYADAAAAYASVRPKSSHYLEAQTKLGGAHWDQALALRRAGKEPEADAEIKKATDTLAAALKARRDGGATDADPGLVANACDLADVELESGQSAEALKLLDPIAKAQTTKAGPLFARLTAGLLRAHVAAGQTDLALADMALLETSGGEGTNLTQLYLKLGQLLEKEMDALEKKNDKAGLNRTRQAYLKFLTALAGSKTGQTYDSLRWVGDNMLTLGKPDEAQKVYEQILKTYEPDPKFQAQPNASARLTGVRLKLAAAFRGQRAFPKAAELVKRVSDENPRALEALMEKGFLLDDEAAAGNVTGVNWLTASAYWQTLAKRLGAARTKPPEYFDAWYHAAVALKNANKPKEARQTLALVMRLSTSLGPEMKQKYKTLLDQLD